jgi:ribosomal protein L24E
MERVAQGSATMGRELPRPRSVRWTDQELQLLAVVRARLPGRSQHGVLSEALTHLAETLRRNERVYLEDPAENSGQGPQRASRPRSVRWTDQELRLMAVVRTRLPGRSQRGVLSVALHHLAETLRRDQRVYLEYLGKDADREAERAPQ